MILGAALPSAPPHISSNTIIHVGTFGLFCHQVQSQRTFEQLRQQGTDYRSDSFYVVCLFEQQYFSLESHSQKEFKRLHWQCTKSYAQKAICNATCVISPSAHYTPHFAFIFDVSICSKIINYHSDTTKS